MSIAPIPKSAPFPDEEIELLNRVVGAASPVQRAWLAGFLAGVEASSGAPQTAAPPVAAEPLTIVYASKSGNSEHLAGDLAKAARKNGLKPTVIDMADLDLADAAEDQAPRRDRRHLGRGRAARARHARLCRADERERAAARRRRIRRAGAGRHGLC